jgi:hypothetical protein
MSKEGVVPRHLDAALQKSEAKVSACISGILLIFNASVFAARAPKSQIWQDICPCTSSCTDVLQI